MKKPIFIIGLHRTGSTLVKNLLNLNSEIAMATDEIYFSTPWYKDFFYHVNKFGDLQNDKVLFSFLDYIFAGKLMGTFWRELRETNIDEERVRIRIFRSNRSSKSIITILLEEYACSENKPRFGVKYLVHFSKIDILYQWYPDCKIIHLTRDPRAIVASKVNDESTKRKKNDYPFLAPIIHCATLLFFVYEYIWSSKIHQKWKNHINYLKFRYEELVINPMNSIQKICDFCEITFEESMLKPIGKPSSYTRENKRGFDKKRVYRWKERLSMFDKDLITLMTKKSMKRLGYENIESEYQRWST